MLDDDNFCCLDNLIATDMNQFLKIRSSEKQFSKFFSKIFKTIGKKFTKRIQKKMSKNILEKISCVDKVFNFAIL